EVVRDMIAPDTLAGVHIYFPDPWPKKRHHKRRLIQPPFVALLASRIAPGGYLHCATDWQPYAEQMLDVLGAEPLLANTCEGYAPRPDYRPQTKFEARGLRLGHGVWDLVFRRRGDAWLWPWAPGGAPARQACAARPAMPRPPTLQRVPDEVPAHRPLPPRHARHGRRPRDLLGTLR